MQNKSDMSVMLKEAGILFAITLIAGLVLGVVYELTKEPIRIQQEKAVQEACAAAFPMPEAADPGSWAGGDSLVFGPLEYIPDEAMLAELDAAGVEIGTVYRVYAPVGYGASEDYGYVVEAVSKNGYGGDIGLYVGVNNDGMVTGVSILELSETAGLGMEAPKVLAPQFAGRNAESFVYTKTGALTDNEVDAISGATVTTSAVVDAVNGSLRVARYLQDHPEQLRLGSGGGE